MPLRDRLYLNLWFNSAGTAPDSWSRADDQTDLSGQPRGDRSRVFSLEHYERVARIAHRGRFDALFLADQPQLTPDPAMQPEYPVDPIALLSAVTARVPDIGAIATASTSFNLPYALARQIQSANLLSGGRVGWNAVTTFRGVVAENFGASIADHEERYGRAQEFLEVVRALWESWHFPWDLSGEELENPYGETRRIDHKGKHYEVAGPLNVPRHPDGPPVIAQAGGSEQGIQLAARHADVVYSALKAKKGAQSFVAKMRQAAGREGRPSPVVMPSISPLLVSSVNEVSDVWDAYEATLPPLESRLIGLGRTFGVDLGDVSPGDQVEPHRLYGDDEKGWPVGVKQSILDVVDEHGPLTYRDLLRLSSPVIVSTPEALAEHIVDWWRSDAADGFTITPQVSPAHLEIIVDELIPLLQNKGVYPTDYRESSLRRRFQPLPP